jgi:hypothetical protein
LRGKRLSDRLAVVLLAAKPAGNNSDNKNR